MASGKLDTARIAWLDVLRLICAIEIVGFHWLRACLNNAAFGRGELRSLIDPYRNPGLGTGQFHYLLLDRTTPAPASLVNDALGWVFGFGWEAVNVFILLSGLSLALQAGRAGGIGTLAQWYTRRLVRVLLPFYLVAIPAVLAAFAFLAFATGRPGLLGHLAEKVASQATGSLAGSLAKHLFLIDLSQPHFMPFLFASAWWFVPAIVVGYLVFPFLLAAYRRTSLAVWLLGSFAVSVVSYRLSQIGVLLDDTWYFVPCQELFSFAVGIAVGDRLARAGFESKLRRRLGSPYVAAAASSLFAVGNVVSWFIPTYAFGSPLYSLGMTGGLAFVAIHLSKMPFVLRLCSKLDPYNLYLLNQPLAFPLAAVAVAIFGAWATAAGLVVFLLLCLSAAMVFGWLAEPILRPAARLGRIRSLRPSIN